MQRKYLSVAVLLFSVYSAFSQSIPEGPLRYTHNCSIEHTTTLQTAPPYQWSMPLQVFQTYFAIDSICRSVPVPIYFDGFRTAFKNFITSTSYDSLFKYLYITMEYNPLLLYQYLNLGNYLNPNYKVPLVWVLKSLTTIINDLECNQKDAFLSLSSGIYHIKITDIINDSTKYARCSTCDDRIKCIKSDVIDIIKGKSLVQYTLPDGVDSIKTISFSYSENWDTSTRLKYKQDIVVNEIILVEMDSSGNEIPGTMIDGSYKSRIHPRIGDEYVVFLSVYMEQHNDSPGSTPYLVFPLYGYQTDGALFKIENGLVNDANNFFGFGTTITVANFISGIKTYVREKFYAIWN